MMETLLLTSTLTLIGLMVFYYVMLNIRLDEIEKRLFGKTIEELENEERK